MSDQVKTPDTKPVTDGNQAEKDKATPITSAIPKSPEADTSAAPELEKERKQA
jgi:hypothetical protein